MTPELEAEIVKRMREAQELSRGYADFFSWATDRDLEEWGVVKLLDESLTAEKKSFFTHIKSRGRPNDPPDCEARTLKGERLAIEVTELVDEEAIREFKKAQREGNVLDWAEWSKEKFLSKLQNRLTEKDSRFPKLKDAPYAGGYLVLVHTDEPELNIEVVARYLQGHCFDTLKHITHAFLLLSYSRSIEQCPNFELHINGQP
jgi:hypothetical protein